MKSPGRPRQPDVERYVPERELGRGGMGTVDLVFDRVRGERVARKRIEDPSGIALLRFKTEFRAIEQLHHPNLVRLFELGQDEVGPFFTMEAVDGVDFATFCHRGVSEASDARPVRRSGVPMASDAHLRRVLPALLAALAFLHDRGVVHADLKPENILVRRDGVVKLLDFGVLARIPTAASGARGDDYASNELALPGVGGTPAYMAGELFEGDAPTPASDVYALGIVLLDLYSGQRPDPYAAAVATRILSTSPGAAALVTIPDTVAPEVAAILARMTARNAHERPTLAEIASAFRVDLARAPVSQRPPGRGRMLVGRDADLDALLTQLDACYAGAFAAVALAGASGVGKTALAGALSETAARGGALALRGRAHLRERLLFNGVDDAVDELARWLLVDRAQPLDARTVAHATQAAVLFPALAAVAAAARENAGEGDEGEDDDAPPPSRVVADRTSAFAAFAELLEAVAQRVGALVLVLDDAQWVDADTAALLETLFVRKPARVFLVATLRSDLPSLGAAAALVGDGRLVRHEVAPLGAEAMEALLVQTFAARAARSPDAAAIARLARVADGRPMLAELGVRALLDREADRDADRDGAAPDASLAANDADPIDALTARLARMPDLGRRVVATLLAFDGWIDAATLAASLDAMPGLVDDALVTLEQRGLVRLAADGTRGRQADLFHDLVRAAAWATFPRETIARAHDGLCDALVARTDVAPARLVRHYVGAGRDAEASRVAVVAADDAIAKHAYGFALELLDVALRVPPTDTAPILRRRADALESFGQYADAAQVYGALASMVPEHEARSVRLAEASALLGAGRVAEGRAKADALLGTVGGAIGGLLARLFAAIVFFWGPKRIAPPLASQGSHASPSSPDLASATLEARWEEKLASLVSFVDPLAGFVHVMRARKRLDGVGAVADAALCEFQLAYAALFMNPRAGDAPLGMRYVRAGEARLAYGDREKLRAAAVAFPAFLTGVARQRLGDAAGAWALFEESLATIARLGQDGTYEQMVILVHCTMLAATHGDLPKVRRFVAALRGGRKAQTASALHCFVEIGDLEIALLEGRFEDAAEQAVRVVSAWPEAPSYQRVLIHFMFGCVGTYVGDPVEGRRRVKQVLRDNPRFNVIQNMYAGFYAGKLALLYARARRAGDMTVTRAEMTKLLRIARRAPPICTGSALRGFAYFDEASGASAAQTLALLEEAETLATTWGEPVEAATARYQRGLRIGGDDGARLVASARAAVDALGVAPRILEEHAL